MKNEYTRPMILLIQTEDEDIISTSGGDTEKVNPFEW